MEREKEYNWAIFPYFWASRLIKIKEFFFCKRITASINKRQLNSKKDTSSFYQIPAYQDKRRTRNNSKKNKATGRTNKLLAVYLNNQQIMKDLIFFLKPSQLESLLSRLKDVMFLCWSSVHFSCKSLLSNRWMSARENASNERSVSIGLASENCLASTVHHCLCVPGAYSYQQKEFLEWLHGGTSYV